MAQPDQNEEVAIYLPRSYAKMIALALTTLNTDGLPVGLTRKTRMRQGIGLLVDGGKRVTITPDGIHATWEDERGQTTESQTFDAIGQRIEF